MLGYPGLAEILLCHDVGSDLTPLFGDNDFIPFRNHRAVGVADHRTTGFEFKILVRVLSFLSEVSVDFHGEILIIKFFATVWQEGRIRGALPSMAGCLMIQNWHGCSSMNSANSVTFMNRNGSIFFALLRQQQQD